jgi:hypothetical protein
MEVGCERWRCCGVSANQDPYRTGYFLGIRNHDTISELGKCSSWASTSVACYSDLIKMLQRTKLESTSSSLTFFLHPKRWEHQQRHEDENHAPLADSAAQTRQANGHFYPRLPRLEDD